MELPFSFARQSLSTVQSTVPSQGQTLSEKKCRIRPLSTSKHFGYALSVRPMRFIRNAKACPDYF
jgi:hypothetical protein